MNNNETFINIAEILTEFPKWIKVYKVLIYQCIERYGEIKGREEARKAIKFLINIDQEEGNVS